jgi:hypothetical protein
MLPIAVRKECDVLVCGGGTAGAIAAIAAARNGAKTVLLERYGFCGGIAVGALVHTLDGMRSCRDNSQFVVGGIGAELVHKMDAMGGMAVADNPPECLTFNPEYFKLAADDMLCGAGVEVLYHLFATAVLRDGATVQAVIAAGKEGLWEIRPRYVIDCTGDGDVSAFAGADFEKDGKMQSMSMHFRIGGIPAGIDWMTLEQAARRAVDRAYASGKAPKYGGPWIIRIRDREVTINCTRLYGDGASTVDLSRAEREGRQDMLTLLNVLREDAAEYQDAFLLASAYYIGVRETRRILGDYQITAEDILSCRPFDDAIALGSWPIDIHPSDGRVGVHPHKEDPPAPYPIPASCLFVRGFDNLATAGRCISATHQAHGSTRVSGTAMALGQAAGTAAGLACESGLALRRVRAGDLQARLASQGAILSL